MAGIEIRLIRAATGRFINGCRQCRTEALGIADDPAGDVAGGAADGLDEAGAAAQKTLLIRVEDAHQRDLGQIKTFAQQVDADQALSLALAQGIEHRDALDGVNVAMEVRGAHASLG